MHKMKKIINKYDIKYIIVLSLLPIVGVIGTFLYAYQYGIVWQEPILLLSFWIISGMGITVGYHRLFSHRSFNSHPILDWIMVIFGATALENSALQWCSNHRLHHRFLDTDKDPYSITKGFFHAHMGWILENKPFKIEKVSDLEKKPALVFQYKYYYILFLLFGVIFPISLGFLWDRPFGSLFWGVFLRLTLVHHFTYFINSLCHYVGSRPYNFKCTSRDSWYMALLTFGEGYHNYHHKFQWDYRNGVRWFHFDPSKWLIWFFSKIGLANELKKASYFQIMKARFHNKWDYINTHLDQIPKNIRVLYENKMEDIREKIFHLEKSIRDLEHQSILTQNKKKKKLNELKLEYLTHLNSLSLILINLQNIL